MSMQEVRNAYKTVKSENETDRSAYKTVAPRHCSFRGTPRPEGPRAVMFNIALDSQVVNLQEHNAIT